MDNIAKELEAFSRDLEAFRASVRPENVQAAVEREMQAFDQRHADIRAPKALAALRAEHEEGVMAHRDGQARDQAPKLEKRHAEIMRGLETVMMALRQAPAEKNPVVDAMRESSALLRLKGRTLADVEKAYQGSANNPTLARLIETDLGALSLKADPDTDLQAREALTKAIRERQESRIPADIREAHAKAVSFMKPLNVSELFKHVRSGRGIATVASRLMHLVRE